jgi:hypothetical protein
MDSFFLNIKNKFGSFFSYFKNKLDENNSWFDSEDNLEINHIEGYETEGYEKNLDAAENNFFLNQIENTDNNEFNSTLNNMVKFVVNNVKNPNSNLLTSFSSSSLVNLNNTLKGILINTIDNISKNMSEEDQKKLDDMLSSTLKNVIKDVKKELGPDNENKKIIDLDLDLEVEKKEELVELDELDSDFSCSSDDEINYDDFEDIDIYDENQENKIILYNEEKNIHNKKILKKELLENCVDIFNNLGLDNNIDNNDFSLKNILEIIKKLD